jgi:hypothetical protein
MAAVTVEDALRDHFSQLHTIELRTARTLFQSKDGISQGTIVIHGSWLRLQTLETFKYHGHTLPEDIRTTFLEKCQPTGIALNAFACNGRHHLFTSALDSKREEFQNIITTFSWKNMSPCMGMTREVENLLLTQTKSLKSISLVRRRLLVDLLRSHENFVCGCLAFNNFTALEYLDIDSRFLVRTKKPNFESLPGWVGLPTSLQTLSIDAITDREVPYFTTYLGHLLDVVQNGLLPNLKNVRCGFMGMRNGKKVQGWKVLGNMPGQFLGSGVWVTGWEYDAEIEDKGDTIAARVRVRAGRRRQRGA